MSTPSIELNDGNKMPQVGFGLWKVDNKTCADQVYEAIKTGYRLFDGACGMYHDFVLRSEIASPVQVSSGKQTAMLNTGICNPVSRIPLE